VTIGASIGIALSPNDGVTSEAIIRNADLALYAAKDRGRGVHHFYDPDLHSDAEERRQLEQDLRDAISNGGLELYYQPVVCTTSETITGFEALLRWNHPVNGPMSPAKFIPIAEDTGLIAPIGEWALRTACRDLANWPESVRVAVNVSPLQFANPALPAIVTNALAAAQVSPNRLELEITESVFLNDDAQTEAMFVALKRVGVRLALDDFGTGYSSLGYLKKAPFDKIKIDQSFVRGATVPGNRNGAIIQSIVSLAEALHMETTAEGVETMDELDLIRTLGCSHIQGYIYSKPLNREQTELLLSKPDLSITANGPRSARSPRRTMFRKIMLEHEGNLYDATIRNISELGAMLEGLWDVPENIIFSVIFADDCKVNATVRWSNDDKLGVAFHKRIEFDASGRIEIARGPKAALAVAAVPVEPLRRVG
jgi:EAL domain-containing protein (putative c-di-GMP-specific phosphodiesterase class I)